jgi:[ribosomal protein S5]-alanine N-acetyltransferase
LSRSKKSNGDEGIFKVVDAERDRVVKTGTYLYGGSVLCDVRIVCSEFRYGTGDFGDPEEIRDDRFIDTFYLQYGSTTERGRFNAGGAGFASIDEAIAAAEAAPGIGSTVMWLDQERANMVLEFMPIQEDGSYQMVGTDTPEFVPDIAAAMKALYEKAGFELPWIGYLVKDGDKLVGTCGFKSPPVGNRVEIAYFTFPEYESQGIATRMAAELIRLALDAKPDVTVTAQTLPEENASTAILKKLNFAFVETVNHPEDGPVWEWHLQR